ncbi:DNA replication/repair protein RecF [Reinekea marinisedimentorum]|uniref:DNA replication and repair protein RecF n=1 Tax=Reinekea marinisedimentorum TaxID=230495 RepID=A0A4R3IFT6_9GAMM|nr:DNA replication/repair protein RecF [Reinekea marinisedimentorum]TCS43852.1 DNA replication and repair protein RecF [Reinekea marinisedimentorum]
MSIRTLSINGVRNLESIDLSPSGTINVFFGENGSGKTSIIESVHLLAMTRSFNQARTRTALSLDADSLEVSGDLTDLGSLSYHREPNGKYRVLINHKPVQSISTLAHSVPTQLIYSGTFSLLEGSPSDRRKFLDWGVFHESEGFLEDWRLFQKCLKNRNSLLRSGKIDRSELQVWERGFIDTSVRIDQARKEYLAIFSPVFKDILSQLTDLESVELSYSRGWDKTRELADVLESQKARDCKIGYTQAGPQRADLRIRVNRLNAVDVLSRGQQKLVICALKIAQSALLQSQVTQPTIFLIDDLPSELDERHIKKLCRLLENIGCQVFMTAVESAPLVKIWQQPEQVRMFHVEHGSVSKVFNLGENNDRKL